MRRRTGGSILMALAIVAFVLLKHFSSRTVNPNTGEVQYISITADQEIALGLREKPIIKEMS